jgi:DNA mismatch repair protein MutS
MVKRGITELPAVAMSDNVLSYKENNFLAAVHFDKTACGISLLDLSTGEFLTGQGTYDYVEKLLGNFSPKEVLYDHDRKSDFERYFGTRHCVFELDDWVFTEQSARQKLSRILAQVAQGLRVEHLKAGIIAAGAIMQYLELTQHTHVSHITALTRLEEEKYVRLDKFTIRSLELLQPMQEDGLSLLDVIDRTVTPMGGRMLRRWLVFPLKDVRQVTERQDTVECFFRQPEFRQLVDEQLHHIGDLARIVSRVAVGRCRRAKWCRLKNALTPAPHQGGLPRSQDASLQRLGAQLDLCEQLRERMPRRYNPTPPPAGQQGQRSFAEGMMRNSTSCATSRATAKIPAADPQRETERTGISSLKVG